MKKLLLLAALPLCAVQTMAESSADGTAQTVWESSGSVVTSSLTFSAATFYDGINGELLYGASAEICRPSAMGYLNYFSLDFSIITTASSGSHGIPALGANFHANDFIGDKFPAVSALIKKIPAGSALLSKLVAGGWGARDFYDGKWRAGAKAGFEFKY